MLKVIAAIGAAALALLVSFTHNASAVITDMSMYIDGNLRASHVYSIDTAYLNYNWSTYSEQPGWHTITVTAINSAGLRDQDSIVVLVDPRNMTSP